MMPLSEAAFLFQSYRCFTESVKKALKLRLSGLSAELRLHDTVLD